MAHRIEVGLLPEVTDAPGEKIKRRIASELHIDTASVRCIEVYTIDAKLDPDQFATVSQAPLCDPVIQCASINKAFVEPEAKAFDWAVEVSLRPGVTDNTGRTAKEALQLALERKFAPTEGVYHARQYLFGGSLRRDQVETIGSEFLANELIQRYRMLDFAEYCREEGFATEVPKVQGTGRPKVESISLERDDAALAALSKERVLALEVQELQTIRDHLRQSSVQHKRQAYNLGPNPTDVELEALAQTWSEHCKHKIFNATIDYSEQDKPTETIDSLFATYIRGATQKIREAKGKRDLCLSVFVDNAGVIRFDDDWSLVFKVETHNSPSALDPYGGALTGIVGVNRDPFGTGMGARLIFNTDVFCFASPFYNEKLPKGLLHPRRVLEGVREGVEHGGNKSGIPTINGSVLFDQRYLGKPLVFCGTGGLLPATLHGKPAHLKQANPGDRIVMVGGRIGADGIHGATFSSEELHEGSPSTAVQIGDPITQKRMTDFLLQARDKGLYNAITDNGAGGLSSSVGEMAESSGGCCLDLTRAPLKYAGLAAWEILVSEAQERMTVAVASEQIDEFMALAKRYQVEATDLGQFTDTGCFHVTDQGQTVALLDMDFFHNGLPAMRLQAHWQPRATAQHLPSLPSDHNRLLQDMLKRLNICSKEYWVRQYDHEVQAGTAIKPLVGANDDGPSDAAVFRPLLDSMRGVAISHGICPRYSDLDTYNMAALAVDEAVRNAVCVGADPDQMAGLDNFCWCDPVQSDKNPDGAYKLGQLVRANRGLYDTCVAYGVPCISGKDSMKNDAVIEGTRISIPPTLLFSLAGIVEDVQQAITMDFKQARDLVYILGNTYPELGGFGYYAQCAGAGGQVAQVQAEQNLQLYRALHQAIKQGLVASCHDCSDGGLMVALAECAFAGSLGLVLDLQKVPCSDIARDDLLLYAESAGRLVVSVQPDNAPAFEKQLAGLIASQVGHVSATDRVQVAGLAGEPLIDTSLSDLKSAWKVPLDF